MVFLEQQDIGWQVLMLSWPSTQIDAVLPCDLTPHSLGFLGYTTA